MLTSPACGTSTSAAWSRPSNVFYLPQAFVSGWLDLEANFSKAQVHTDIAVATVLQLVGRCSELVPLAGQQLPSSASPATWRSTWNATSVFVQPVELASTAGRGALKEIFAMTGECVEP